MKYEFLIILFLVFSINIDAFGQGKFGGGDGSGYAMAEVSNITLPVELIYFDAFQIADKNAVQINWEAAVEVNLEYYTLEKSKDAISWKSIGKHYPNASLKYQYVDNQPCNGITYYRLQHTDLDGTFGFSRIVFVHINNDDTEINISPNPSRQFMNLSIRTTQKSKYNIQICDFSGEIIWEQKIEKEITDWTNRIEIKKAGVYIVNITNDDNVFSEKIIILE